MNVVFIILLDQQEGAMYV